MVFKQKCSHAAYIWDKCSKKYLWSTVERKKRQTGKSFQRFCIWFSAFNLNIILKGQLERIFSCKSLIQFKITLISKSTKQWLNRDIALKGSGLTCQVFWFILLLPGFQVLMYKILFGTWTRELCERQKPAQKIVITYKLWS